MWHAPDNRLLPQTDIYCDKKTDTKKTVSSDTAVSTKIKYNKRISKLKKQRCILLQISELPTQLWHTVRCKTRPMTDCRRRLIIAWETYKIIVVGKIENKKTVSNDTASCRCIFAPSKLNNVKKNRVKRSSPRPISTAKLNTSLCVHLQPINLVVFKGSY